MATLLMLWALLIAVQTTSGLTWPCEIDFYRDMGGAQSYLDGRFGQDPAYLGETNWYDPLQPTLFAGLSYVTGRPLHELYASWGPFINLLGPIGFFVLAVCLFDHWTAVMALAAYLFLGQPNVPSWFQATYSPWAWPMDFAQGFFYFTVASTVQALRKPAIWRDIQTGVLLGLTFMAHTAPTLILVFMYFGLTIVRWPQEKWRSVGRLFLVGGTSFIVSMPYLVPLVRAYHMHVLNTAPSEYAPIGVQFVILNLFSLRAGMALIGLMAWLYAARQRKVAQVDPAIQPQLRAGRQVFGMMMLISLLWFVYGMSAQILQQNGWRYPPRLLPTYHFHLYLKAAESLLFAVGITMLVRTVMRRWQPNAAYSYCVSLQLVCVALLVGLTIPRYLQGIEHQGFRSLGQQMSQQQDRILIYRWIATHTQPDDVFLSDPRHSVMIVAAANRKVVCMHEQYSNIYTNYHRRLADLEEMYAHLAAGRYGEFKELATAYHVSYVLWGPEADVPNAQQLTRPIYLTWFQPAFTSGKFTIFRIIEE